MMRWLNNGEGKKMARQTPKTTRHTMEIVNWRGKTVAELNSPYITRAGKVRKYITEPWNCGLYKHVQVRLQWTRSQVVQTITLRYVAYPTVEQRRDIHRQQGVTLPMMRWKFDKQVKD
jgi:hypothetical protein